MNPATLAPHRRLGWTLPPVFSPDHLEPAARQIYEDRRSEYIYIGQNKITPHMIAIRHNFLELLVHLMGRPREPLAVLGHLEARHRDTTAIGSLCVICLQSGSGSEGLREQSHFLERTIPGGFVCGNVRRYRWPPWCIPVDRHSVDWRDSMRDTVDLPCWTLRQRSLRRPLSKPPLLRPKPRSGSHQATRCGPWE
jgi:hypothetical protein